MKFFVVAFIVFATLIADSYAGSADECADISQIISQLSPAILDYIKDFIKNRPQLNKGKSDIDDSVYDEFVDLFHDLPLKPEATKGDKLALDSLENDIKVNPKYTLDNFDTIIQKCLLRIVIQLNFNN